MLYPSQQTIAAFSLKNVKNQVTKLQQHDNEKTPTRFVKFTESLPSLMTASMPTVVKAYCPNGDEQSNNFENSK